MQQSFDQRPVTAPAVLGVVLIVVGAAALILRQAGLNFFESIGEWGWPFFIIIPGVVLLALSLVPTPPRGLGFATAGAIVTTVGALLLYQSRTEHWESWAYAWALIPLAVGVALVVYGWLARERGMVSNGMWMAGGAGVLFVAGLWFFEGLFAGDRRALDATEWWPVAVIVLGAIVVVRAFFKPAPPTSQAVGPSPTPSEPSEPNHS